MHKRPFLHTLTVKSQTFSNQYQIHDTVLGSGKFGIIYAANDRIANDQVACKIVNRVHPECSTTTIPNGHTTVSQNVSSVMKYDFMLHGLDDKELREVRILAELDHVC